MATKGVFSAKEATIGMFKNWKAKLFLGAGLLLLIACTTPVPLEDESVSPPAAVTTTSASDNGDALPSSGGTPAPDGESASGDSQATGTTDSDSTGRRPPPSSGDSTVKRFPDTPTPEPAELLPKNTLALVMAVSGGSSSSTLKTIVNDSTTGAMLGTKFIALESSSKSVILYLPDSGEATVLDSYSSPSYAPHFKRPYTVDGRLYVSNKFTNGGKLSITEYDTESFKRKSEWATQTDALDPGYAVAGGQVYFKTGSTQQWSMSRGFYNAPGDYISSPFSDRWVSTELETPELRFSLVSGGDILYGAKLPSESDPTTGVFIVDPQTGQGSDRYITAFEVGDWNDYLPSSWRNVVIEDGTAYWAGFRSEPGGYIVEILAASLADSSDFTVHEFEMPSNGKAITGFNSTIDADGGFVLIKPWYEGGDWSKVLIYDTARETARLIDTDFHIVDAQLIFIEG